MSRPRPKSEMVVKKITDSKLLSIVVHSGDARAWVGDEAPKFGEFLSRSQDGRKSLLVVDEGYDVDEVKEWLESQGI